MEKKEIVINKWTVISFVLAIISILLVFVIPYHFTPNTTSTLYDANKFCSKEVFGTSVSEIATGFGNDVCSKISIEFIAGIVSIIAFLGIGIYFIFNKGLPKFKFGGD